ncbi:MAG: S41 family peptidase [Chloroflexota bacterium]|nr:S41 family peptidase [Chloroflexota bacterium]
MWKILKIAAPVMVVLSIVVTFSLTGCELLTSSMPSSSENGMELFEEAWGVVLNDYVDIDEVDLDELSRGAIRGMLEALDDPYTSYLDTEHYEYTHRNYEGSFGGIGAEISVDQDDQLIVVAPIVGTPAEREGLLPGDKILEVDGQSTEGMSTMEAVLIIRGEPGTQVTLTILHEGEDVSQDIVITREIINVDSVYMEMLDDGVAHIDVRYFSNRTADEMISAIEDLLEYDATGVILDLRSNPGGVLTAAVDAASLFLDEGVVVSVLDNVGESDVWVVRDMEITTDLPLAVLVNENSASASEVVAGALQDYGRGYIIGTTTYGKGSVNHIRQLSDGSAIYITIARWYTPDGRLIEGLGITPDETVEFTIDDMEQGRDPQLERAIEYITNQG